MRFGGLGLRGDGPSVRGVDVPDLLVAFRPAPYFSNRRLGLGDETVGVFVLGQIGKGVHLGHAQHEGDGDFLVPGFVGHEQFDEPSGRLTLGGR